MIVVVWAEAKTIFLTLYLPKIISILRLQLQLPLLNATSRSHPALPPTFHHMPQCTVHTTLLHANEKLHISHCHAPNFKYSCSQMHSALLSYAALSCDLLRHFHFHFTLTCNIFHSIPELLLCCRCSPTTVFFFAFFFCYLVFHLVFFFCFDIAASIIATLSSRHYRKQRAYR